MENLVTEDLNKELECTGCGAFLKYAPGTNSLKCEYCSTLNEIKVSTEIVQELDFEAHLNSDAEKADKQEVTLVKCTSCGAETTLLPNITSSACPFCTTTIVLKDGGKKSIFKPKSLLPFKITTKDAFGKFKNWISSLWFAPNDLKQYANTSEKLSGLYIPYWTYDSKTHSSYTGERGIDHHRTETYTTTENGRQVTKSRIVTVTHWHYVSGNVYNSFDDILINASRSLPDNYCRALEPWDLHELIPYDDKYLSGFKTESYQIGLKEGFSSAKHIMDDHIKTSIRRDIGGDHQRIHSVNTSYDQVTFKHILLPIYISAYKYKGKVYRIMINGRTGEVQGERPYSWIKITFAILAGIGLLGLIYLMVQ